MTEAKSVELAEIPDAGNDLEDYVAALFQASGYYIEKNLVERAPDEILELDIVATYYTGAPPASILVEAKGGKWGYPDIFKVAGWMRYLNQSQGAFFVKNADKDLESVRVRVAPLSISVVNLGDFSNPTELFESAGLGTPSGADAVHLWRYSNLTERKLMSYLLAYAKSKPDAQGPRAIVEYHRLVNDGIFFTQTIADTIELLYEAYKSHPKLSLGCAQELEGKGFDPDALGSSPLIGQTMYYGDPLILQTAFFAEHRARLAILRGAVNLLSAYPDGYENVLEPGSVEWLTLNALPATFHEGLAWLREQPTFHRYAVLWQQFLWGWGGFYLKHRHEEEFHWMSQYSGIPVEEVPQALRAFNKFFPFGDTWFADAGMSDIRTIKMMPMVFQGIGVHHRRQQYNLTKFSGIGGSGYTVTNLARWYTNTLDLLT